MKISKFAKFINISQNEYAIYNIIYFEILYIDKEFFRRILNFEVSKEEKKILLSKFIYIVNEKVDKELYELLVRTFEKNINLKTLYVVPSASCNMKCDYCFVYKNKYISNGYLNMTRTISEILINRVFEYIENNREEFILIFYGGEPLLNKKEFFYIVETLRKKGFTYKISMITNATLLDEEVIKFLSKYNVSVGISIDGPNNINERRGYNNKVFNNALDKKELLDKYSINFGISLTLTEKVINNFENVIKWYRNENIKNINYNMLHFDKNVAFDYIKNYYEKATKFIINSYLFNYNSNIYEDRINRKLNSFYLNIFKYADCSAIAGEQITVSYDGSVSICNCDFNYKNSYIGNITTYSFQKLLNIENKNINIKCKSPIYNEICLQCYALPICGGGCYKQYNKNNIDVGFCIHSKLMMINILEGKI
ncbi:radical SAM protein [Anaerococcus sp. AGMB09787]|uniref:radical SAM/SPASM domain-containing protein n=1 Tax=Anaerococcus sp. AGMB09787 TaxID=2922869 RepID=UPI001FB00CEB|nr:radical SAM protein [Anaerococcus sp. AGMB09787]